ncbi:MAG: hypothetical protein ACWIPJ_04785 [Polaribacter sp.]
MRIERKTNYTLISSDENSFEEFYTVFLQKKDDFKKNHIVLQFSDNISVANQKILLLLDLSKQKKEDGRSFIIVYKNVNVNDFPENLIIVSTLTEAEDVLEIEELERELGF